MFCTKCGTSIQDGQAFCPGCGTAAGAQGQTPPAEQTVSEPSAPPVQAPPPPPMPPVQQYTPPAPPQQSYAPPPPAQQYETPPAPNSAFAPPPAQPPQQPIYTPPAQPQQPAYPQQPAAYDAYGQPQYAPPAPPAKKKAKWPIVLTIAAVLLIAVGAVLFFVLRSPKSTIGAAIAGVGNEALERLENSPAGAVPLLLDALQKGTVTVSFDLESRWDGDARGSISFVSDAANCNYYMSGNLDLMGVEFDNIELFMDSERIAVGTRMFDSNYYGITYDTFREDFRTFGRTIGIDSATIDEVADIVDILNEAIDTYSQGSTDSIPEDYQVYIDIFTSILDRAEQRSQKTDIRVSGESYSVTKIDVLITKDVIVDILNDLYDALENDDNLKSIYESVTSMDYYAESYSSLIRGLRDSIREFERSYDEDSLITLSFFVGSRNRLMRLVCEIDVTFDGYSEYYEIIADFGASVTDTWTLSVDGDEIIRWEYRERGSNFENTIVFADEFEFSSSWNPGTGAFTVSYYAGWNRGEISGTYKPTSDGFEMRVNDLGDDIYGVDRFTFDIRTSSEVNIPRIDYINMDRWDEALIERLITTFSNLFMPSYGGYGGGGIEPFPAPGNVNSEIVGAWGFYDGTGTYFFWRTDYVEFYSDGGVYNYSDDDYGTWTLNGNNLSVTTQSGTTYTYIISLDGDYLSITDWDNDTGYFVRLW